MTDHRNSAVIARQRREIWRQRALLAEVLSERAKPLIDKITAVIQAQCLQYDPAKSYSSPTFEVADTSGELYVQFKFVCFTIVTAENNAIVRLMPELGDPVVLFSEMMTMTGDARFYGTLTGTVADLKTKTKPPTPFEKKVKPVLKMLVAMRNIFYAFEYAYDIQFAVTGRLHFKCEIQYTKSFFFTSKFQFEVDIVDKDGEFATFDEKAILNVEDLLDAIQSKAAPLGLNLEKNRFLKDVGVASQLLNRSLSPLSSDLADAIGEVCKKFYSSSYTPWSWVDVKKVLHKSMGPINFTLERVGDETVEVRFSATNTDGTASPLTPAQLEAITQGPLVFTADSKNTPIEDLVDKARSIRFMDCVERICKMISVITTAMNRFEEANPIIDVVGETRLVLRFQQRRSLIFKKSMEFRIQILLGEDRFVSIDGEEVTQKDALVDWIRSKARQNGFVSNELLQLVQEARALVGVGLDHLSTSSVVFAPDGI